MWAGGKLGLTWSWDTAENGRYVFSITRGGKTRSFSLQKRVCMSLQSERLPEVRHSPGAKHFI